jgi:formylglycine-generating enzyme required for sulfatase activity
MAARGSDGRIYPWGDEPDFTDRCNCEMAVGDTTAVGSYPDGVSPCGAHDMSGNVWEWTRSLWGGNGKRPRYRYPYDPHDGREDQAQAALIRRVARGGSYGSPGQNVRCAARIGILPEEAWSNLGFRIVGPATSA